MNIRLQYDPTRILKLQKNELLNELRTKLSHKIYEVFKEAEHNIWNGRDQGFQFVSTIIGELRDELEQLENELSGKAKAWSAVEAIEAPSRKIVLPENNKVQIPKKTEKGAEVTTAKFFDELQNPPAKSEKIADDDFDFFDDF